jgi:hypothetical protein
MGHFFTLTTIAQWIKTTAENIQPSAAINLAPQEFLLSFVFGNNWI